MVRGTNTEALLWLVANFNRQNLSDAEKKAYINAELCLMNTTSKLDIEGAQNLWDDLHYIHIIQSNIIHFTVKPAFS